MKRFSCVLLAILSARKHYFFRGVETILKVEGPDKEGNQILDISGSPESKRCTVFCKKERNATQCLILHNIPTPLFLEKVKSGGPGVCPRKFFCKPRPSICEEKTTPSYYDYAKQNISLKTLHCLYLFALLSFSWSLNTKTSL